MSHPYNCSIENLARNLQIIVAPNLIKYIGIIINKGTVWETGKTIATA